MTEEEKKATHFANVEDLISSCKNWIYEEDRDAFYRWFDFGAMEDLINLIEKQNEKIEELKSDNYRLDRENQLKFEEIVADSIPKSVIREKIEELNKLLIGNFVKGSVRSQTVITKMYLEDLLGDEQ